MVWVVAVVVVLEAADVDDVDDVDDSGDMLVGASGGPLVRFVVTCVTAVDAVALDEFHFDGAVLAVDAVAPTDGADEVSGPIWVLPASTWVHFTTQAAFGEG